MIDTIKLVIQNFDRPINVDLYVGESRTGTYPNATQCSAQLRPILDDEKKKVYLPRVKLVTRHDIRGWTSTELTIELSIPKLLFGNNFSEVSDKDFTRFLNKLTRLMNKHWPTLKITRQDILTATVRRVDFCKNIVFYDHVSTGKVIRELGKARLNSAYDIGTIEYRNGGRAIRAHTKHRDMIVYSKIEELRASKRSESRSVEGDSWVQHKLLDKLEKKDGLNVTRVELKINTLKQLKSELDRVGLDSDKTTFFDIYSSDVAKMILSYWWDKFIGGLASSRYRKSSVEQIFSDIIVSSKTLRIALATLGYN